MIKKGQSIVEAVVAVGVVILVISGVVVLLVNVLGARTKSFDRKIATELAQKVVETFVADESQRGGEFWSDEYWVDKLGSNMSDVNFGGYFYNVDRYDRFGGYEVVVVVGWQGSGDTVTVSRLFTRT